MSEELIGEVTHYFSRAGVAVLNIKSPVRNGEWIRVRGNTTDLRQRIDSMEIDRQPIEEAKPGDDVGLKVADRVRVGDSVYREAAEPQE